MSDDPIISDDTPASASEGRETAFAGSKLDRDTTLAAVHRLEAAAGMAGPDREVE
jgi:hypothetical protein